MATESDYQRVSEMSREQLEHENEALRGRVEDLEDSLEELTETVDFIQDKYFQMEKLVCGASNPEHEQEFLEEDSAMDMLHEAYNGRSNNDVSNGVSEEARSKLLPIHKMWLDIEEGHGDSLGVDQQRAACVFGYYVERAKGESNEIDASGQTYSGKSTQVKSVLEQEGLLDSVADKSKSVVVGRVMREVQSLSKDEKCDCENIDECEHGLITFRPGGTHALAVQKKKFNAAMQNAYSSMGRNGTDNTIEETENRDAVEKDVDEEAQQLMAATPNNAVSRED